MIPHRFSSICTAAVTLALAATQAGCYRTVYVREVPVEPAPPPPPPAQTVVIDADADDAAYDDFYEPLGYYGVWVDVAPYGRVWQPAPDMAGADFRPYASGGYWAVNDDGDWVFVSRYHAQWGWATYHYGRWVWNDWYGWVWVPGRRWAPSWVEWRYGGGYVGWAPLGPPGVVVVHNHYTFVNQVYIGSPDVYTYRVPDDQVHTVYVSAPPVASSSGGQGQPYVKSGPPLPALRAAGVTVASAAVKVPEKGSAKAQARLAVEAGAERKASGRVVTTPTMRGNASAGSGDRGAAAPTPPPAPGSSVTTQPGMLPPSSPSQAPQPGTLPASATQPGQPGYGQPGQPGQLPPSSPNTRPSQGYPPPSTPAPTSRPSQGLPPPSTPTPPATRPSTPAPQPPAARPSTPNPPSAAPKPAPRPTATAKPKPAPKPKKR